jgi:CRISPR-associated endoribonuclease Cas6
MAEISAITLLLQPQTPGTLPVWVGRAAHANFLHTLQALHPDVSRIIHDHSGAKPFTSSTLIGARKQSRRVQLNPTDTLRLRYTTIHPGLTQIFHQGLLPEWIGQTIELQQQPLRVIDIQQTAAQNRWAGQANYVELVDQASVRHQVCLHFTSPTAFKRTAGHYTPLPQPELVFASLLDRWNAFAPFRLPEWLYDTIHHDIVIDQATVQTEVLIFARGKRGSIPGFTGKVTYRFLGNETACRYLNALAQFAKYSGVGVKTTVGMGQALAA